MKKCISLILLLSVTLMVTGCATIIRGGTRNVNASADLENVKVYVDGEYRGTAPVKLALKPNETYEIEFRKSGYAPVTRTITNHIGVIWVILDIMWGLVPVIVDAATGDWYELDQSHVSVRFGEPLEKREAVPANDNSEQGLSDTLTTSFVKTGKFSVLERAKMEAVLKEQAFQKTGCTDTECAVEAGKILNVKLVVIGSIARIDEEYVLNVRIVDVESSEIITAEMEKCADKKDLFNAVQKIAGAITDKTVEKYPREKQIPIAVLDLKMK